MLVLTRKYQEKIRIGNGITITVLRAKGKAVRLGIEAPADVPVIRGELAFDHPPIDGDVEDSVASVEPESEGRRGARRTRQAPANANWAAGSDPRAAGRNRDSELARQVALRRVPREKAGEILPQLLSGNGPLREMLNQRSATM